MNVWEKAGMSQWAYSKLSWPEKKSLLIKYGASRYPRTEQEKKELEQPPKHWAETLLKAWFQHNAETETIKEKYPWAI